MITRQHRKTPLRRFLMPAVALSFLAYFGFHAFSGSFGIWSMERMEKETEQLTVRLDSLKKEHARLERQVATVRPDSLDPDIVDMEARNALNLMREDEVVIPLGAAQQPTE
jgi:cell division protein FtsB